MVLSLLDHESFFHAVMATIPLVGPHRVIQFEC